MLEGCELQGENKKGCVVTREAEKAHKMSRRWEGF
jgi:hypothetical protein